MQGKDNTWGISEELIAWLAPIFISLLAAIVILPIAKCVMEAEKARRATAQQEMPDVR